MTLSFEVEGTHCDPTRIITPSHSLNVAVSGDGEGEFGFPTRNMVEISGETGIGKSTVATNFASWVSQALGNLPIAYLDLEGQDSRVIFNTLKNSGYGAPNFRWVSSKGKGKSNQTDEAMLEGLEDALFEDPPYIGILDSVAAISPVAEREGDLGDANMGRRAFPMAQFVRRVTRLLQTSETPTCLFMLNHQYEKLGAIGKAKQYTSPGGSVKNNMEKLRIRTSVPWVEYISAGEGKAEGRWQEEGAWILEGKIEKNRSGSKNETFQVFVYGGQGVHVGMSALIDCLAAGLAEVKTGGKVVMDGQDFGTLKKIIANKKDDKEFFVPFQNALKVETVEDDTVSEDSDE